VPRQALVLFAKGIIHGILNVSQRRCFFGFQGTQVFSAAIAAIRLALKAQIELIGGPFSLFSVHFLLPVGSARVSHISSLRITRTDGRCKI